MLLQTFENLNLMGEAAAYDAVAYQLHEGFRLLRESFC